MRALLQRVSEASVRVDGIVIGQIGVGLLLLVGVEDADTEQDVDYLAKKIVNLRVFDDDAGVMNRSVVDISGSLLVVSQFTLHASTAKGNRPSYIRASKREVAEPMYELLQKRLSDLLGKRVEHGLFGADMKVSLVNDGPVTIWLDSKNKDY